jgi:hypothetical protein
MNCFCGQSLRQVAFASLLYTSGLHFVPPPFVTFRLLSAPSLGYPRKSASIHSITLMPARRSIPLPFGFSTHNQELKSKTGSSIPPNPFATFHSVNTLAFPNPISGMPCGIVHP